jgi:hypothetical protein
MCPFCFGSAFLMVSSVLSAGGFGALAVKKLADSLNHQKSSHQGKVVSTFSDLNKGGSYASHSDSK